MDRLYLDYAASTPVDPRVFKAMEPYFSEKFGNAGSLHSFGQDAIAAVDHARETIAHGIGAAFREVIFTGSATEANNFVVRGAAQLAGRTALRNAKIIVSAIEHESILESARHLEHEGVEVVYAPVDEQGVVDPEAIAATIDDRTVLVSIMYANNEIGTIEPVKAIADAIASFRRKRATSKNPAAYPLFHTDAAQAPQFLTCRVGDLGVDLMTLSSHKIYGPKGAGVLYARNPQGMPPLLFGGGQEFGLRSGTENVPAIVGFGAAFEIAARMQESERERIGELKKYLWERIRTIVPDAEVNGIDPEREPDSQKSLPNILNVYFPKRRSQELLTKLDLAGLAISAGSACHSRAVEPSHVIPALGYDKERAASSIRFSLGRPTTRDDIDRALEILRRVTAE